MKVEERSDTPILTTRYGNDLVVRFIRPKARNPLSIAALESLHKFIDLISSTTEIKKVIFTGTDDVFASGADLREIAQITEDSAKNFAVRGQSLMNKIARMRQPTIAAINGFCFGGALDLVLACNKRIGSPSAIFCHPGVSLGIITGWGGTQRLPRLVGQAKATEIFLTAKRIGAEEALNINLIDKIIENPLEFALANYC
ncbi:MAG: enoyl-CoA hydratase/isomerase family protein [Acidobacteriota bacterium]